ncbi:unnamed protein product [Rhizophagus irregularis]|nr:unnamed protein product [Rhizophagus irregularis]
MIVDELAGGRSLVRIITQVIGIGIEEAIQRLSKYSSPRKVIQYLLQMKIMMLKLIRNSLKLVMEIGEKYAGAIAPETLVVKVI